MPGKPSIESLCKKHRNENVHSEFVARLALAVFDEVSPHLGLPPSHRPLLRAAALLHDIGYFERPSDHHAESGAIVMERGVAGLTPEQCRIVAAAIALHRRDFTKGFGAGPLAELDDKEAALRIGAILRIADGLDHGHLQNVSILSVKQHAGGFLLGASSPGYGANIGWAAAKADLWKKVFGRDITIVEAGDDGAAPKFTGIVRPRDGVLDTARRLLYLHYRIVSENHEGMLSAETEEPLHDGRVALRRFRATLRLFRRHLPARAARGIDARVAALAAGLSPIRDNDVWLRLLSSKRVLEAFRGDIEFVHFHALQSRRKKDDKRPLRKLLAGDGYASLMRDIGRFLRVDLPRMLDKPQYPFGALAARRILSLYFTILSHRGAKRKYDAQAMHRLRKTCRRARYWAEFAEPALGRPATLLARRLKACADILGDLHDADTAAERLLSIDSPVARALLKLVQADRRRLLSRFGRSWRSLSSPSMLYSATALSQEAGNNTAYCILVRHATAADGGAATRTLSKKGVREAQAAGRALALMQCRPDVIAASPLARASDTAAILAQSFSFSAQVVRKSCLEPGADVGASLAWLGRVRARCCVCVGHMPHLAGLASALLGPREKKPADFARASACCISFEKGFGAGAGSLEWYFSNKKFKRIVSRVTGKT
jgi:CHAD domain-containing protein/phosphohistidine phosphatase SixA